MTFGFCCRLDADLDGVSLVRVEPSTPSGIAFALKGQDCIPTSDVASHREPRPRQPSETFGLQGALPTTLRFPDEEGISSKPEREVLRRVDGARRRPVIVKESTHLFARFLRPFVQNRWEPLSCKSATARL